MDREEYIKSLEKVIIRTKNILRPSRTFDRLASAAFFILDSVEIRKPTPKLQKQKIFPMIIRKLTGKGCKQ